MSDQAEKLRQLALTAAPLARHTPSAVRPGDVQPSARDGESAAPGARSLLFTSGKGGVGTSNIVLSLAIALGELKARVVVVDADIGLANLDLLGGFYPRFDLGDVLLGRCTLTEAVVPGPGGIQVVPGAHASRTSMSDLADGANKLTRELTELAHDFDFMLIDGGSGLGPGALLLAAAARETVVVTTPEPTSIADAHAAIGRFHQAGIARLRVVVNQAASRAEAALVLDGIVGTSRQFKGAVVEALGPGFVRVDDRVKAAVRLRRPFVTAFPAAVASREIRRIAQAVIKEDQPLGRPTERAGARGAIAARWLVLCH